MGIKHLNGLDFHDFINNSNIPVVIDFWAEWCGPCKMIAPTLEKISQEYTGKILGGKVDIDDNQELAEQYHVRSIPTLMVFIGGEPSQVIVGAQKNIIEDKIKQLV